MSGEQAGALGGCGGRGDDDVSLPAQQQLLGRRRRLVERVLTQRVARYTQQHPTHKQHSA